MLSKKMMKVLKIDIIFIRNLKKLEKFEADCIWEDYNIRPKEFTIRIDWHMSEKRILQALAHEMTHIKQYSTGEMTDLMGYNQIIFNKHVPLLINAAPVLKKHGFKIIQTVHPDTKKKNKRRMQHLFLCASKSFSLSKFSE